MALNPNKTTSSGMTAEMVTYYDKQLIKNMRSSLVHTQFGQKRPMPARSGKTVNFRKVTPFSPATDGLTEAVIPDGHAMEVTEMTATVKQYGDYVTVSDFLELTAIDPVIDEAVEENGYQAALTIDHVTRDIMHAGTNIMYAGGRSYRHQLLETDVLTSTIVRKAVRTLKKARARKIDGYYIAIVGPDTTYDLQSDTDWKAVATYQDKMSIYTGEIGILYGVRFVETEEAKKVWPTSIPAITLAGWTDVTKTATIDEALTSAEALALAGQTILIQDISDSNKEYYAIIASATAGAAGAASIILTENIAGLGFTPADGDTVVAGDAGAGGYPIASTIFLGKDAYGLIDIAGKGAARSIVKPKGSAGTADPLDQFSTVGWKVEAYTVKRLQEIHMLRVEHGYTDNDDDVDEYAA